MISKRKQLYSISSFQKLIGTTSNHERILLMAE
jgi:hypothetical protein